MALVSSATLLAEIWRDKAAREKTLAAAAAAGGRFKAAFLGVAGRATMPAGIAAVALGHLADLKTRVKRAL